MGKRVLVVEDDELMLEFLAGGLGVEGFEIIKAMSLSEAFKEILDSPPNIVLADYELGDGTAFDLLAWLKQRDIGIPLIVLTAHASIDLAVDAVKHGAEHFVPKPVDLGFLTTVLRRTLERLRSLQKDLANNLERARYERDPFLGKSASILELRKAARRMSETNNTLLIQGETGTGKGVLARWLHKTGPRSSEAFVELNCAGLSSALL